MHIGRPQFPVGPFVFVLTVWHRSTVKDNGSPCIPFNYWSSVISLSMVRERKANRERRENKNIILFIGCLYTSDDYRSVVN